MLGDLHHRQAPQILLESPSPRPSARHWLMPCWPVPLGCFIPGTSGSFQWWWAHRKCLTAWMKFLFLSGCQMTNHSEEWESLFLRRNFDQWLLRDRNKLILSPPCHTVYDSWDLAISCDLCEAVANLAFIHEFICISHSSLSYIPFPFIVATSVAPLKL